MNKNKLWSQKELRQVQELTLAKLIQISKRSSQ
jgi:hypothetical protein